MNKPYRDNEATVYSNQSPIII